MNTSTAVALLGGPLCGAVVPWPKDAPPLRHLALPPQFWTRKEEAVSTTYVRVGETLAVWSNMPEATEERF